MNAESRKKSLQYFFGEIVEPLGFKFTPDVELMNYLLDQEVMLENKHSIPFCPCQPLRHKRERDMQIVCPCIPFHRTHFDEIKRCWCGLFVHKDILDPDTLPQLSQMDLKHE